MAENANRSKMVRYIDLSSYTPYPKNLKIASVFKEIGLADELGSRIKRITECSKVYSNLPPKFKEDDIFQTIIYLDNELEMPQYDMLSGYKKILYRLLNYYNTTEKDEDISKLIFTYYKNRLMTKDEYRTLMMLIINEMKDDIANIEYLE